jgi:hypothetical protein
MHLLLEKLQVKKLSVGQGNMVTLALVILVDDFFFKNFFKPWEPSECGSG